MDLVKVMYRLRAPGGCPWDREQTHQSLARHLLEETHETLDAIDSGDLSRLREELGDLLLQVLFHAEIADEEGGFDIDDVAEGVTAKLVRRHPHVFGDVQVESASEVLRNWESIKAEERGDGPLEDDGLARLVVDRRASPADQAEASEEIRAVRDAIVGALTPHQREVLVAITLNGVPIDVLAERRGTTRGALYKTLHDARRRLRAELEHPNPPQVDISTHGVVKSAA